MAPGSIFHHISFRSTILVSYLLYFAIFYFPFHKLKIPKKITLPFIHLYQISLLQITMKGLTTPYCVGCKLVFICAGIQWLVVLSPTGLIPWFSKAEGNTYSTLLHHPFLFKGKTTASSRGSKYML